MKFQFSKKYLVGVAEETSLKLALSETPKTGFLVTRPISITVDSEIFARILFSRIALKYILVM